MTTTNLGASLFLFQSNYFDGRTNLIRFRTQHQTWQNEQRRNMLYEIIKAS
jgi:hypothetical protein